jgi:hypothetical protein
MPALSWRARALALFAAIGLVVPPPAHGQDLGTGRRVQGTALITAAEVGDVSGHVVGVVELKGLTFFADGEIATRANPATSDPWLRAASGLRRPLFRRRLHRPRPRRPGLATSSR